MCACDAHDVVDTKLGGSATGAADTDYDAVAGAADDDYMMMIFKSVSGTEIVNLCYVYLFTK